ncbi:hypothetical protein [Paraburkholderia ribeironis]|uniref:hypothetical protein n=1 Tax=Paraburkholderia ribeironis TaxID=1247936 RepID=UPI001177CED9|nr:hypothetical protein [Paraburkholderia ribeironis]
MIREKRPSHIKGRKTAQRRQGISRKPSFIGPAENGERTQKSTREHRCTTYRNNQQPTAISEMNTHPTDIYWRGARWCNCHGSCGCDFQVFRHPSGHYGNVVAQAVAPIVVAAAILLTGPLLFRTVLRSRRDQLLLDEDLNALSMRRTPGLIGGFLIGITFCAEIL